MVSIIAELYTLQMMCRKKGTLYKHLPLSYLLTKQRLGGSL